MIGLSKPHDKNCVRLPERRTVTIIAGFRSTLGVVLCSDTQETIEFAKRHVAKLKVYPRQTSV